MPPRLKGAVADLRLRHVVDDHRQCRVALDETDDVEDVARLDKRVEAQAELEHGLDDRIELPLQV